MTSSSNLPRPSEPVQPVLELRGVEKVYGTTDNPLRVLSDINLTVDEGEYMAIVGPSGSGKSTMLNILGCLDSPSRGQYLIQGEDVAGFEDLQMSHVRNTRIGFVFQSFHLVSHLTVLENVELPLFYARQPRAQRHARCRELIEQVGLSDRSEHVPSQLSGGERQRVAIARALSNEPAVVLADEPTGNLDSHTGAEILDLFDALRGPGRTLIMVTHDEALALRTQRLLALRDGRVQFDGPPADRVEEMGRD